MSQKPCIRQINLRRIRGINKDKGAINLTYACIINFVHAGICLIFAGRLPRVRYAGHINRPGGSGVMASPQICILFESRLFCAEQASSVLQTFPSIQGIRSTISPKLELEAEEYAAAAQ